MKFRLPLWKKGKTYKRPYHNSRRFDRTCRSHGSCPYCRRNRLWSSYKRSWWSKYEIDSESK